MSQRKPTLEIRRGRRSLTFRTGSRLLLYVSGWLVCNQGPAQELSLRDAVQAVLAGPQAQAATAQTEQVQGQLRQAGLGLNPRLFLQAEDWRFVGDNIDYGSQTENYAFLSQTFETGGKRDKRVALGRARLEQARAEEQLARLGLVARVSAAYWNAVLLRRIIVLLQQDMHAVDGIVQYDQDRVQEGAMRGVDLLRMKIERDRLLLTLRATERDAAQAQLELLKQMGRSPSTQPLQLVDALEASTPVAPQPVADVLAQRPDLMAQRDAVQAAEADVTLQKAVGVPNLDLVGGYKRNGSNNTGYSSLQIDLPFRNRNQGEVQRAEAAVRYAKSTLQASEMRVRGEIAQSEEAYRQQREIVEKVLPDMRANAQENLRLLTEAYRMGGIDLLRFVDAERTAFETEVSALRTLSEFRQAGLRLQLSYGEQL